jgi:hypothetical protein
MTFLPCCTTVAWSQAPENSATTHPDRLKPVSEPVLGLHSCAPEPLKTWHSESGAHWEYVDCVRGKDSRVPYFLTRAGCGDARYDHHPTAALAGPKTTTSPGPFSRVPSCGSSAGGPFLWVPFFPRPAYVPSTWVPSVGSSLCFPALDLSQDVSQFPSQKFPGKRETGGQLSQGE